MSTNIKIPIVPDDLKQRITGKNKRYKSENNIYAKAVLDYEPDLDRLSRRNIFFRNEKKKREFFYSADKYYEYKKNGDYESLDKMPKNAHPCRIRNLCGITGRSRGVLRNFGICRAKVREMFAKGEIVGGRKISW